MTVETDYSIALFLKNSIVREVAVKTQTAINKTIGHKQAMNHQTFDITYNILYVPVDIISKPQPSTECLNVLLSTISCKTSTRFVNEFEQFTILCYMNVFIAVTRFSKLDFSRAFRKRK